MLRACYRVFGTIPGSRPLSPRDEDTPRSIAGVTFSLSRTHSAYPPTRYPPLFVPLASAAGVSAHAEQLCANERITLRQAWGETFVGHQGQEAVRQSLTGR